MKDFNFLLSWLCSTIVTIRLRLRAQELVSHEAALSYCRLNSMPQDSKFAGCDWPETSPVSVYRASLGTWPFQLIL